MKTFQIGLALIAALGIGGVACSREDAHRAADAATEAAGDAAEAAGEAAHDAEKAARDSVQ